MCPLLTIICRFPISSASLAKTLAPEEQHFDMLHSGATSTEGRCRLARPVLEATHAVSYNASALPNDRTC